MKNIFYRILSIQLHAHLETIFRNIFFVYLHLWFRIHQFDGYSLREQKTTLGSQMYCFFMCLFLECVKPVFLTYANVGNITCTDYEQ